MKFSITFKYSNVTFKNKENKETVTFDSKAEGNTFTFDNVDEDVVLGIVKGIKDRKACQVFAYDNLRTNFVNVIARNKCKELYDKLDKGGWKVEDVAISNVTIKDLEFTKPTMNARETLTVESISKKNYPKGGYPTWVVKERLVDLIEGVPRDNPMWADLLDIFEKYYGSAELEKLMKEKFPKPSKYGESKFTDNMHKKNSEDLYELNNVVHEAIKEIDIISNMYDVSDTAFEKLQDVRTKLLNALPSTKTEKMMKRSVSESKGDINDLLEEAKYHINEAKAHTSMAKWNVDKVLGKGSDLFNKLNKLYNEAQNTFDCIDDTLKGTKSAKRGLATEGGKEQVEVEFKKTPEDGEVIAFFPETRYDGSCNPGMIMSYMHVGQHGEASVDFYNDCTACLEEDYADLLAELEKVYDDCELVVVE